ncbi:MULTISPECIES: NUDIX domain-containing protein [unclassified Pseudomonas]|uniref:NUDIX hydrolase n=1 Tax=unclassified Pseudomonas TaxID=196821 RepID=UPI0011990D4C|nr:MULTISPECIES: NUDIX domain-containing protein [unclassified Pseudomonas]TWC15838.1 mutator protein MutT [Pseudomonas sp. SJZ075]TWC24054.1 mutator protein MutT [Pseudomonas sp. SJZ074]TWC31840.1 mutator protein MutT [Pseudomonas sp. SJZ078]TWC41793.1 mutator protein MutT [Pseudomonas sp. SJZ085]TWC50304.1 mutator protein MutT [Pseudomonas sp. SJZ124]
MFPVSIKGVLQSPEGLVVLMLNERDEWELPGGRIELGETAAQCLAREITEELAVEVSVGEPLDSYLFEVIPGKHVFISTYRCQLVGGFVPTVSHEHKEIGLFEPGRLPAKLPEGYRASIAKALQA